jgi:hypothetical protein
MPKGVFPRKPKTHCKRGHEFTPETTYVSPAGVRYCRICRTASAKQKRHRSPEYRERLRQRDRERADRRARERFVRLYGMTQEQIENLAATQGHACACCGKPGELQKRHAGRAAPPGRLVVDHCHATDTVRGLLCDRCNKVLGLVGDDAALLWQLAAYVAPERLRAA